MHQHLHQQVPLLRERLENCTASAANVIQNQNTAQQTSANFWIDKVPAEADTSILTPTLDTATGVALNIGTTNATSITIGKASQMLDINSSGVNVNRATSIFNGTMMGNAALISQYNSYRQ